MNYVFSVLNVALLDVELNQHIKSNFSKYFSVDTVLFRDIFRKIVSMAPIEFVISECHETVRRKNGGKVLFFIQMEKLHYVFLVSFHSIYRFRFSSGFNVTSYHIAGYQNFYCRISGSQLISDVALYV